MCFVFFCVMLVSTMKEKDVRKMNMVVLNSADSSLVTEVLEVMVVLILLSTYFCHNFCNEHIVTDGNKM